MTTPAASGNPAHRRCRFCDTKLLTDEVARKHVVTYSHGYWCSLCDDDTTGRWFGTSYHYYDDVRREHSKTPPRAGIYRLVRWHCGLTYHDPDARRLPSLVGCRKVGELPRDPRDHGNLKATQAPPEPYYRAAGERDIFPGGVVLQGYLIVYGPTPAPPSHVLQVPATQLLPAPLLPPHLQPPHPQLPHQRPTGHPSSQSTAPRALQPAAGRLTAPPPLGPRPGNTVGLQRPACSTPLWAAGSVRPTVCPGTISVPPPRPSIREQPTRVLLAEGGKLLPGMPGPPGMVVAPNPVPRGTPESSPMVSLLPVHGAGRGTHMAPSAQLPWVGVPASLSAVRTLAMEESDAASDQEAKGQLKRKRRSHSIPCIA